MSVQTIESPPSPPPVPSYAFPMTFIVAIAFEAVVSLARLGLPTSWVISEKYYLISTGLWACSALLFTMGFGELVRRLSPRQAAGAQMAMISNAVLLGIILAGGVIMYVTTSFSAKAEMIWKVQQYFYLAVALAYAAGLIIAAGGFERVAGAAIGLILISILLAPPPFLSDALYKALGKSYRYVYIFGNLAQLAMQAYLIREAARSSTRDLPAQPTAPFALLGGALRARVIAMFVLIAFTFFAMGGRSLGAMKFAMVAAPLINMGAFLVFAVAALRAGRGLDDKLQVAFAIAGGAAAWCAGVLAIQTPAIYQMIAGSSSYDGERASEVAQALVLAMPIVATISVVIALVAANAHIRKLGHHDAAAAIGPRTTAFVVLMLASVLVQIYVLPKATNAGELAIYGLVAAFAGVASLLVAAGCFKQASEATSTTALPTATVIPPL